MTQNSPWLARRYIGETLERLRTEAGMSRMDIAVYCGRSAETIRRWENGENAASPSQVEDIARRCGASQALASRLRDLSYESRDTGLWEHRNVPAEARVLWESELTAKAIHSIELDNIPGLLQTPEYHKTVQSVALPVPPEVAEASSQSRVNRQSRLFVGAKNPPNLHFLMGRAAIDYMSAWPEVQEIQLAKLREFAELPFVTIDVLPTFHAAMLGSFTIITPHQGTRGARPFVYLESVDGVRYEEKRDVVSLYERVFTIALGNAVSLEEYLNGTWQVA